MRYKKRGFTLVEIMIVVAIIALLAAIAIPNLLRARHNANESAAISALRTICSAQISYRAVSGEYADTLATLGNATPPYIDSALADQTKQGYDFRIASSSSTNFQAEAKPDVYHTTGTRGFYVTSDGVMYGADAGAADTWVTSGGSEIE